MGKAIPIIIVIALAVYALFDVIATPRDRVRYLPKPLWVLVVLIPALGVAAWLVFGKVRTKPAGPRARSARSPGVPTTTLTSCAASEPDAAYFAYECRPGKNRLTPTKLNRNVAKATRDRMAAAFPFQPAVARAWRYPA